MTILWALARWLWWLCVAAIPWGLYELLQAYLQHIGCAGKSTCYARGKVLLEDWNILTAASALLIWPVAFYFVLVAPVRAALAWWRRRSTRGA